MGIEGESAKSLEDDKMLLLGSSGSNSNASAGMEIVSGFPVCPRLDNFTIIGDLSEALLQPNASLLVDGQHIPTEEFCIERVVSEGRQLLPAKVFACSEHAAKG